MAPWPKETLVPPWHLIALLKAPGIVGVIGGSLEYTGAPFFACMASMLAGADLGFVLCSPKAAIPIKSYSPELIVLPLLPQE